MGRGDPVEADADVVEPDRGDAPTIASSMSVPFVDRPV